MAERKHINLIYRYDDNWMGGTYYILNIIKSLKLLSDDQKPELLILHPIGCPLDGVTNLDYPFISFRALNLKISVQKRLVNKLFYYLNGKRIFNYKLPSDLLPNTYPLYFDMSDEQISKGFYWIPDFQEEYYPEFFSELEIRARKSLNTALLENKSDIVFSSQNALNDYNRFYPKNHNNKVVLNFASFVDESFRKIEINTLLEKFKIIKPYFIVPNQFWKHKNHKVVLEALVLLKDKNPDFQVVFTGKLTDFRNPEYSDQILQFVKENGIEDYVLFLGFIDRAEQLKLMSCAIAIIQPSLFEGWSTVVEDSKVINQFILVSDIPLHREQIKNNNIFFNPHSAIDLAEKMESFRMKEMVPVNINYKDFQLKFAQDFISIFN